MRTATAEALAHKGSIAALTVILPSPLLGGGAFALAFGLAMARAQGRITRAHLMAPRQQHCTQHTEKLECKAVPYREVSA